MSDAIASEFIGDQPSWFTPLAFAQAAENPFSCARITTALHQDVNDITVLIDGPPELRPLALNGDKDFINVPRLA